MNQFASRHPEYEGDQYDAILSGGGEGIGQPKGPRPSHATVATPNRAPTENIATRHRLAQEHRLEQHHVCSPECPLYSDEV